MGILFGRTGVEEPAFRVVRHNARYEVRVFPAHIQAAVLQRLGPNGNSKAFPILAGYIGVTSAPKNDAVQSISMTAPVVQTPKAEQIAMTAPVVQSSLASTSGSYGRGDMSLAFILPAKYKTVEDCPVPNDPRITLKEVEEKNIAVSTFSGWVTDGEVQSRLEALLENTKKDGLMPVVEAETPVWQVAQYNPPFTIPWLRRNEIWLVLEGPIEELHSESPR
jgi:hypothetical protein